MYVIQGILDNNKPSCTVPQVIYFVFIYVLLSQRREHSTSAQSEFSQYFHRVQSSTKSIMEAQQICISGFLTASLIACPFKSIHVSHLNTIPIPVSSNPTSYSQKGNLSGHATELILKILLFHL